MAEYPIVSVLVPILNEEANLLSCLSALAQQTYPKDRFEILIADGGSTDSSLQIIKSFNDVLSITVIDNSERKEAEWGKALAFNASKGKYVQCVDADMTPSSPDFFLRLVSVLESDPSLAGIAAGYVPSPRLSVWSRFLSYDEFQRDPLFQVLTPSMDKFVVERHADHDICEFPTPRVPPMGGTTMLRRELVNLNRWGGRWSEIDGVAFLVKQGHQRFGYITDIGWIHQHCTSLGQLLSKRRRNILGISHGFLHSSPERDFVWLDTSDRGELMRLMAFIVSAQLIVPEFLKGIRDARAFRSWEQLLRPVVALTIVDTLLYEFVRSREGRRFIRSMI